MAPAPLLAAFFSEPDFWKVELEVQQSMAFRGAIP
jgi:hypothetical protein